MNPILARLAALHSCRDRHNNRRCLEPIQVMELLNDGAIQMSALADFREDLQEKMKFFKERWS